MYVCWFLCFLCTYVRACVCACTLALLLHLLFAYAFYLPICLAIYRSFVPCLQLHSYLCAVTYDYDDIIAHALASLAFRFVYKRESSQSLPYIYLSSC